jgi:hypothetical protein
MGQVGKWAIVYKYFDVLEGQQLEAVLKAQHIPVMNILHQDTAFDGIFTFAIGAGILKVREDFFEQAKQVVAEFEREQREIAKQEPESTRVDEKRTVTAIKKRLNKKYISVAIISILAIFSAIVVFNIGQTYYFKNHPNPSKASF